MATSKGVIQGYTGVAAVDAKHQIIVEAQAHGTGSEQELLVPVVEAMKRCAWRRHLHHRRCRLPQRSQPQHLAEMKSQALIADNGMRGRDERFAEQAKYKQAARSAARQEPEHEEGLITVSDRKTSTTTARHSTCMCPAGKTLYGNGSELHHQRLHRQ